MATSTRFHGKKERVRKTFKFNKHGMVSVNNRELALRCKLQRDNIT